MTQIKIKRGIEANRTQLTPATGEPIWTTDKKELWVGDGATQGGVPIGTVRSNGGGVSGKDTLALYKDTTGKVLHPQTKDEFLKAYSTSAQVDAKITSKVPAIKVHNATHADKATDADKLGNKEASLYVDNSRMTANYTENSTSKVVTAAGIRKMNSDIRAAVPNIKVALANLAETATNANKLGNQALTTSATANTVVSRDSAGDVHARLMRTNYANQDNINGAMAFRNNNSSDDYIRFCSDPAAIRTWMHTIGNHSNQDMSGEGSFFNFNYAAGSHGYLRGVRGTVRDWYVGRPSSGSDGATFSNYKNASITLKDDDTIYYKGAAHTFSNKVSAVSYDTKAGIYPSLSLYGTKGIKAMFELDGGDTQNINVMTRETGTNHNTNAWTFARDGRFHTPRGFISHASNYGTAFSTIVKQLAPFVSQNVLLGTKKGTSLFSPILIGAATPDEGAGLTTSFGLWYSGVNTDSAAIVVADVNNKDVHQWHFNRTGTATCTGGWVKSSDRRLKANIKPLINSGESAMSIVNSFSGQSYTLIDDDDNRLQYGFIAQDLQAKYPQAVTESPNMGDVKNCLGIDYDSVVPLHHEALKELEAENKLLKARLATIEAKLGI